MPKLHLLDPGLQGRIGHHFTYSEAICAHARGLGYEPAVWACTNVRAEVCAALPVEPVFRDHPYLRPFPEDESPEADARRLLLGASRYTLDMAERASRWATEDLVIVHTASPAFLIALAGLLLAREPALRAVAGLLPYDRERDREQFALPLLALRGRAVLYTHARSQSRWFETRFGVPVRSVPLPLGAYQGPGASVRRDARTTVGYFGDNTRADKGFALLPGIVEKLAPSGMRFVIHAARDVDRHGVHDALARLRSLARDGGCTLAEGSLSGEEYRDMLARCDAVVMPYDPEVFRMRESAVLGEALAAGAAVCVPEDTLLDETARECDALATRFTAWTVEGVAEALRELDEQLKAAHTRPQASAAPRPSSVSLYFDQVTT